MHVTGEGNSVVVNLSVTPTRSWSTDKSHAADHTTFDTENTIISVQCLCVAYSAVLTENGRVNFSTVRRCPVYPAIKIPNKVGSGLGVENS